MNLQEVQDEWERDCRIDDNHLGEASTYTPNLHAKYLKILINTKLKLTKIQADYNILRKNKFKYYRGELSREELSTLGWEPWQYNKPLKNEMDEFLQGDKDLIEVNQRIEYLNVMLYTLESILSQIKARDWQLKNAITWKQFLSGM